MSNPYRLGQILADDEVSWGEDVHTFSALQLPITAEVDVSGLVKGKIDSGRIGAYRNQRYPWIDTGHSGSFKVRFYMAGHGSSTVGSPTATAIETYLAWVIGNGAFSSISSHTAGTGSTATSIVLASTPPTFAPGGLVATGTKGDARGDGQVIPVATQVTTTLTPLVAAAGSLSSGDVVRPLYNLYPTENGTSSALTSKRHRLLTANMVYDCHGCFPMGYTITGWGVNECLTIEVDVGVSWFGERSGVTFPATVTRVDNQPGVNNGGSLHTSASGTATRNVRTKARGFSVSVSIGIEAQMGYTGISDKQSIVGAVRTTDEVTCTWIEPADAQTSSPVIPGYSASTTPRQIMWTGSSTDGKTVAFYAPYVIPTTNPLQSRDGDTNVFVFTGVCATGPTTTSDLTLSAYRFGLG